MAEKKGATIVIKKKKGGHGHGHHGGAWKVAYADFVTAMMAFFLVMWLMGSDEETKAAIENYFNNPSSPVAWRPELQDQAAVPLGIMTGAGESVLRGDRGEVEEDLIERPRPVLQKETGKEGEIVSEGLVATEAILNADVIRFSVREDELFRPGSTSLLPTASERLKRIGVVSSRFRGRLSILGTYEEGDLDYELRLSRAVAVKEFLVSKRWASEEEVSTRINKDRSPASMFENAPRKLEFVFSKH